jgi:hypothetical protein
MFVNLSTRAGSHSSHSAAFSEKLLNATDSSTGSSVGLD